MKLLKQEYRIEIYSTLLDYGIDEAHAAEYVTQKYKQLLAEQIHATMKKANKFLEKDDLPNLCRELSLDWEELMDGLEVKRLVYKKNENGKIEEFMMMDKYEML